MLIIVVGQSSSSLVRRWSTETWVAAINYSPKIEFKVDNKFGERELLTTSVCKTYDINCGAIILWFKRFASVFAIKKRLSHWNIEYIGDCVTHNFNSVHIPNFLFFVPMRNHIKLQDIFHFQFIFLYFFPLLANFKHKKTPGKNSTNRWLMPNHSHELNKYVHSPLPLYVHPNECVYSNSYSFCPRIQHSTHSQFSSVQIFHSSVFFYLLFDCCWLVSLDSTQHSRMFIVFHFVLATGMQTIFTNRTIVSYRNNCYRWVPTHSLIVYGEFYLLHIAFGRPQ